MNPRRFLPVPVFVVLAALMYAEESPPVAGEPPAPAEMAERARLADALFPADPASEEAFAATLKAASAAGVSPSRLLESEVYRALVHRVRGPDCMELAVRLEKSAPEWRPGESVFIDGPAHAKALSHLLRALHASRAGDEVRYRAEVAEAVWQATRVADLAGDIEAGRRREALLASPAFVELARSIAAGDEAAARRAFDRAYWADAPLSCDLAVEKLDAMRDAKPSPPDANPEP